MLDETFSVCDASSSRYLCVALCSSQASLCLDRLVQPSFGSCVSLDIDECGLASGQHQPEPT